MLPPGTKSRSFSNPVPMSTHQMGFAQTAHYSSDDDSDDEYDGGPPHMEHRYYGSSSDSSDDSFSDDDDTSIDFSWDGDECSDDDDYGAFPGLTHGVPLTKDIPGFDSGLSSILSPFSQP